MNHPVEGVELDGAQRGDLACIVQVEHLKRPDHTCVQHQYSLAKVVGVTKDGEASRFELLSHRFYKRDFEGLQFVYVVSRDDVDVEAVLKAYSELKEKRFATLTAVRDFIAPFARGGEQDEEVSA